MNGGRVNGERTRSERNRELTQHLPQGAEMLEVHRTGGTAAEQRIESTVLTNVECAVQVARQKLTGVVSMGMA